MNPDDSERLEKEAKRVGYNDNIQFIAEMTKDFNDFTAMSYKKDPKLAYQLISGVIASMLVDCCDTVDEALAFNDNLKHEIREKILEIDKILSKG